MKLATVESKYSDLKNKKANVINDRNIIEKLIIKLDKNREYALISAWKRVNNDFGTIFNMFLSGSSAKLSEPEDSKFMEGLEICVSFGGVWKKSLSELLGGQKSLLALSFILALLRFNPAPIYILDEIDAALDLSHTYNIGRIIKTQFPQSQFIIVSLKDGMFNNANVLFNIKFMEGRSIVKRLMPQAHTLK